MWAVTRTPLSGGIDKKQMPAFCMLWPILNLQSDRYWDGWPQRPKDHFICGE